MASVKVTLLASSSSLWLSSLSLVIQHVDSIQICSMIFLVQENQTIATHIFLPEDRHGNNLFSSLEKHPTFYLSKKREHPLSDIVELFQLLLFEYMVLWTHLIHLTAHWVHLPLSRVIFHTLYILLHKDLKADYVNKQTNNTLTGPVYYFFSRVFRSISSRVPPLINVLWKVG